MKKERTQKHIGELTSATHYSTPSQNDAPSPKKQPQLVVLILANLLCLLVAGLYVWSTHDLIGFILLYGIATGTINAREVAGAFLPKRSPDPEQKE